MKNISFSFLAFNLMNKNEKGSAVPKLYNCNNDFLSVNAFSSSSSASNRHRFLI